MERTATVMVWDSMNFGNRNHFLALPRDLSRAPDPPSTLRLYHSETRDDSSLSFSKMSTMPPLFVMYLTIGKVFLTFQVVKFTNISHHAIVFMLQRPPLPMNSNKTFRITNMPLLLFLPTYIFLQDTLFYCPSILCFSHTKAFLLFRICHPSLTSAPDTPCELAYSILPSPLPQTEIKYSSLPASWNPGVIKEIVVVLSLHPSSKCRRCSLRWWELRRQDVSY